MSEAFLAALRVYDDATLETLANKGLVRRAAKDVEAGKAAVAAITGDQATLTVDGETVVIDANGPAKATCTCPAKDVCRHRIAAVMALRGGAGVTTAGAGPGAGSAEPAAAQPPEPALAPPASGPLAELLALDLAAIMKWAGKASLRAALELIGRGPPAVQTEGAALVVRLAGDEPEVRYLAGQGLDGILSKATLAKRKALHTGAVLAVRRAHGLPTEPEADPLAPAEPTPDLDAAPARRDPGFHAAVRVALEDAARTGLNQAPLALEERLFELSVSSRADRLPRLASTLREISGQVRDKRRHAFTLVPSAMLGRIATAYALNDALDGRAADDARGTGGLANLQGDVRQAYHPVEQLTLDGLGANFWQTTAGARGVTGYFYARELGRIVSASHARGNAYDAAFDPEKAYLDDRVWGAASLQTLLRATVTLTSGSLSDGGRLSLAGDGRATFAAAVAQRADALAWPVTACDWAGLQTALQRRFNGALAGQPEFGTPLLLAPAAHARMTFNATLQEHTWPIADASGRWIGLTLRHGEADEMTAARLQRLSALADVALVLAHPRPEAGRIILVPTAVIAATPSEPKLRLYDLQLQSRGYEQPSASMRLAWFAQLAKQRAGRAMGLAAAPANAPPVDTAVAPSSGTSTTRRSLAAAADTLLGIAEMGGRPLEPSQTKALAMLAARFERFGLLAIAQQLAAVAAPARPNASPSAAAMLRSVHLIDRASVLTRPLPWLA